MTAEKHWTAEDLAAHGYYLSTVDVAERFEDSLVTYEISNASAPLSERVDKRARDYILKMAIRVVCIVGAVFTDGALRWICVAGAVLLPWVAVVLANGESKQESSGFTAYLPEHHRRALEIGAASNTSTADNESDASENSHCYAQDADSSSPYNRTDVIDISEI